MIAFAFDGDFSGAFREIPLRDGETLDQVAVSEEDRPYRPGASAELGSSGEPGTFGTTETDKGVRIVWHYRAQNEQRSFRIHYRLRGVAVAYDDIVDVNLQVWGDEWEVGLGQLTAAVVAPGDMRASLGPPGLRPRRRHARRPARDPARGRHSCGPVRRAPRSDPAPCVHRRRQGCESKKAPAWRRSSPRSARTPRPTSATAAKIDEALDHLPRTIALLLALALGPALLVIGLVWLFYGREHKTPYDREYEQEPPTETEPALVPSLLAQGGTPGSLEFTATLFDLIRRGRYRAEPVTTERKIWGGLKTQQVADLELSLGDVEAPVEAFEAPVAQVVDAILAEGPERLSLFRDRIEDDRTSNSARFSAFKSAVGTEIAGRKWFSNVGLAALLGGAAILGSRGRADALARSQRLRARRSLVEQRRRDRARHLRARGRGHPRRRGGQPPPLAPPQPRPPRPRPSAGRRFAAT